MTRFEKDYSTIKAEEDNAREIFEKRKKEINSLEKRARETRNRFVYITAMQELTRLRNEYRKLSELI